MESIEISYGKKIYRLKYVEQEMISATIKCHNIGCGFQNSNKNDYTGKNPEWERSRFAKAKSRSKAGYPHKKNGIKAFKKIQHSHITR